MNHLNFLFSVYNFFLKREIHDIKYPQNIFPIQYVNLSGYELLFMQHVCSHGTNVVKL